MKKVILTGATGFIGTQVTKQLLSSGNWEVHAVAPFVPDNWIEEHPALKIHKTDLLDNASVRTLVETVKAENLLHLAWDVTHGKYWTSPNNLLWTAASINLFHEFVKNGGKRAVCAGTCAEYDWNYSTLSELTTPLNPATLYGRAKDVTRQLLETASRTLGVSFAWGRIFFLYGPNEQPERLIPSVMLSLLRGEDAKCTAGLQRRDFMHVHDVAKAFVTLLESSYEGAVNIASGECLELREVVSMIGELAGKSELIKLGALETRPGDPDCLEADTSILREKVGFKPDFNLKGGLKDVLNWWSKTSNSK